MSVPTRLAAFAGALALAFGAGLVVGEVVGPIDTGGDATHSEQRHGERGS